MSSTQTASEFFQAGNLQGAVDAALSEVKASPSDTARRGLLAELLCFVGDWERADKQIDTIGQQDPDAIVGLSQIRQLIRAEISRQECFQEGRPPELVAEPDETLRLHLEALVALREQNDAQAADLLRQAEASRQPTAGKCGDLKFDDFRDIDDVTASFLEVLASNGKYFWIPIGLVGEIEFHPPKRPRDLLWRKVDMTVRGGPDGEVYLPVTYPGTIAAEDDGLRLGRATDWSGGDDAAPARGIGQRTFLVGDEPMPILQIATLEFEHGSESSEPA